MPSVLRGRLLEHPNTCLTNERLFAIVSRMRWQITEQRTQGAFWPDEQLVERHVGTGEYSGLEFLHVNARAIVNRVPAASHMPFEHTINTYRGCSHACTYCFARPTHAYLDLGIGVDFDTKIVVKVNSVERARAELAPLRWGHRHVALGTNTDPYQKAEGKYHLTQGLIGVFAEHRVPFSILTKSTLILRDARRLAAATKIVRVQANLSVATLDQTVWKASEPGTPPPAKRIEAVARLNSAGVPCGVLMGPILPMLSDSDEQIRATVKAAVGAGATNVVGLLLHLRPGVRDHYFEWLAQAFPHLVEPYERRYGSRAYLPHVEQKELSTKIARFVEEARAPRRARSGRPGSAPVSAIPSAPTNRAERLRQLGIASGAADPLVARPSDIPVALALPLPFAVIA